MSKWNNDLPFLIAHAICCGILILLALGVLDLALLVSVARNSVPLAGLSLILLAMTIIYYFLRRGNQRGACDRRKGLREAERR